MPLLMKLSLLEQKQAYLHTCQNTARLAALTLLQPSICTPGLDVYTPSVASGMHTCSNQLCRNQLSLLLSLCHAIVTVPSPMLVAGASSSLTKTQPIGIKAWHPKCYE